MEFIYKNKLNLSSIRKKYILDAADDELRQLRAIELDLAQTSSWTDIIKCNAEIERKEWAHKLGIQSNTCWADIVLLYNELCIQQGFIKDIN